MGMLLEAEQKMEVCAALPDGLLSLNFLVGVGSYPSRPSTIFGTKSPSSTVDVRNKLQYGCMELVLHACLPRVLRTCPQCGKHAPLLVHPFTGFIVSL